MTAPATATMAPAGPQCMRALERANQVRLARAALKRRVAIGEIEAADVILDSPWEAESMAVAELLMSQRRWGRNRCRKLLCQIPMSEGKTIGSMTDRQRRAIARELGPTPLGALSTRYDPALRGHGGGESYALQPLAVLDRPGKALEELH